MAEGRVIPHHGEAIVLRSWPFHEADLLVSLFTRDQGRVKGVARHAMRSRKRFGGALEPATHVLAHYTERPRQDLVRLDSFEILWSPLTAPIDALRLAALQLVTEVLEAALPDLAPDDNIYRLALTTLTAIQTGTPSQNSVISTEASQSYRDAERRNPCISAEAAGHSTRAADPRVYLPVTYFCLWMNRLMGWMPELGHCAACGLDLRGDAVYWSPTADGVTCADDRRSQSKTLTAGSVAESHRIARTPLPTLLAEPWPATRSPDLRAFAIGTLERHLERRLRSASALLS